MMIMMAVLSAIGVFMSLDPSGMTLGGGGKLLEEMVHPMRRGGDQEEQKRSGCAEIQTAPAA